MPTLLSGPAGADKTALARELLRQLDRPGVVADFQAILSALLLLLRDDTTGRYPPRLDSQAYALPLAEYLRRAIMTVAIQDDVELIVTNSDGSPQRREFLLSQMGPGAVERIVDPGKAVVSARLADASGLLSPQCSEAIARWYGRL